MIRRRDVAGLLLAAPFATAACSEEVVTPTTKRADGFSYLPGITTKEPLIAPRGRPIKVAFAINPGVQAIDVAGPWEVFQDTYLPDAQEPAFAQFTVSDEAKPVRGSGGLALVPDFTPADDPIPDVIVVPHFDRPSPFTREVSAIHTWIRRAHDRGALTMSICTGAFQLARTGLLDHIPMTTNRLASDNFARTFPHIDLRPGPRFVEAGRIATAGGLSAGIDLALRTVARYFGDEVARQTADRMEYAGEGWQT
ncbi:conserved exported hypothetical protein [Sphingomonas sp. EC-HK361]|uniref:DJ-1/PfpI family protein n=1 Tax=Sphingomonas sp. EC-HK361 TaxID=2038397 RepID=UPI0012542B2C|nr:DJ-1/PfpI family protein [Sphingomonas sp. EC-HK361]VVT21876.1 conserved exported hypothetical protein [Sphingomonas sp. EC-HK361]